VKEEGKRKQDEVRITKNNRGVEYDYGTVCISIEMSYETPYYAQFNIH
jgi:hypothetical protein